MATANWVPMSIYGTTAAFLEVRDWTDMAEGEPFTERDVRNSSKVCLVGQTLVRELFSGQSPIGKEIRIQNVAFKVIGVMGAKGANMMGMDQDDIVLAPWTTIKYRVSGSSASASASSQSSSSSSSTAVNTLNDIYPGSQQNLYPAPSATQQADTPAGALRDVNQIMAAAASSGQIPEAIIR